MHIRHVADSARRFCGLSAISSHVRCCMDADRRFPSLLLGTLRMRGEFSDDGGEELAPMGPPPDPDHDSEEPQRRQQQHYARGALHSEEEDEGEGEEEEEEEEDYEEEDPGRGGPPQRSQ
jgi:hypothetical protein